MNKKPSKDWLGAVIAGAAILLFCVAIFITTYPILHPRFTLTAETQTSDGVAPDTAFTLTDTQKKGTPPKEILENITFLPTPSQPYTIENAGEFSYRLVPQGILKSGETFAVEVYTQSFSFLVQNSLSVRECFPANGTTDVPITTGIEVVFAAGEVANADFANAFRISPKVDGKTTVVNNRYIFTPFESLAYDTTYTIKINESLVSTGGVALAEAYRFSFKTQTTSETISNQEKSKFQMFGNGITVNATTMDAPIFQAFIADDIQTNESSTVAVELRSFADYNEYARQLSYNLNDATYGNSKDIYIETDKCEIVSTFEIAPVRAVQKINNSADSSKWILQFPEALPEGWYAVSFKIEENNAVLERKIFLQVSDLSVFYMWSEQNFLAWVNDVSTGKPVKGAHVAFNGEYAVQAVTNQEGVAQANNAKRISIETSYSSYANVYGNLISVKSGDKTFIDINQFSHYLRATTSEKAINPKDYISYLYLDRPIYHTSDTIHIWGMVRPRDSETTPAPETVIINFAADNSEHPVKLMPDGTFTMEIPFKDLVSGRWSRIELSIDDVSLDSGYFTIEDFVKPIYTVKTTTSRPVYSLEKDLSPVLGLELTTFDGTPAVSADIMLSVPNNNVYIPKANMITDENGKAFAEIHIPAGNDTWRPENISYYFSTNSAQAENFTAYGHIYVIHRDTMLQTKIITLEDGRQTVKINSNKIDTSGIKDSFDAWDTNSIKGASVDIPITARIYKIYYTKEETGKYYDYINRVMQPQYTYTRREEYVETRKIATKNGEYLLENLPKNNDKECYYVEFEYLDSLSRPVKETTHLGQIYSYYGMQNGNSRYEITKTNQPPSFADIEDNSYWNSRSEFYDDESVVFSLTVNEEVVTQMQGRILYCIAQDDFSSALISQKPSFTVPFSEELLPNYIITGAYFDGKNIFLLENMYMRFNPKTRALEIELTTDKETYSPAEEVKVQALVKNKFTGEPAPDVTLVLSVVDEAVFAVEDQYVDILQSLYSGIYRPDIHKYASNYQTNFPGAGEKGGGGGGGGSLRSRFQDTAYFKTIKTDASGKASCEFTLPDNITSWRLTSLGVSAQNFAGDAQINISATKDFFLMPLVNEKMLEGDAFSVGLRGAGKGVTSSDGVQYTVNLRGPGVDETKSINGLLSSYTPLVFSAASKEGEYTITIKGNCKDFQDAIQLPVTVMRSGVEVNLVRTFDISKGIDIDPLRYPVSIAFYSEGAKAYNSVLRAVSRNATGARADARLAKTFVAQLMQSLGRDWYDKSALEQDLNDLNGGRVLSLFPYSQENFELSLKAHMAVPSLVSLDFFSDVSDYPIGSIVHYGGNYASLQMAKALTGKPIEDDLNAYLTDNKDIDYVEKIWLAMALYASGDKAGAEKWYQTLVADNTTVHYLADGQKSYFVGNVSNHTRSQMECTAAALMLATQLKSPHAEGLALYMSDINPQFDIYILEQMYYLRMNTPTTADIGGTFSYVLDGETIKATVGTNLKILSFNEAQMKNADLKVLTGKIYADVYYTGAPQTAVFDGAKRTNITKTIEPVGENGFAVGKLVKITISPDFSEMQEKNNTNLSFVIDDYIPSGLRFEKIDSDMRERGWYLTSRQGQRMQFNVYNAYDKNWRAPIVYYARVATPGTFISESCYMNSSYGDAWGASERSLVNFG